MEQKRVKDLMLLLEDYATIASDATVREALVVLNKAQMGLTNLRHNHRAILVLDDSGHVIGKLSHWAILRALLPRSIDELDRLHLDRLGVSPELIERLEGTVDVHDSGLVRMYVQAGRLKVTDAMVPAELAVDEEAPLADAIHLLVRSHAQSVLVTRNSRIIGVLRLSDVFEEVADQIRRTDRESDGDGRSGAL